jgi:hypothetical protein
MSFGILSFPGILMLAFAFAYYKAAEIENINPWLWCGLSIAASYLTLYLFWWGMIGEIFGQVLLFAAITGYRVLSDVDRHQ